MIKKYTFITIMEEKIENQDPWRKAILAERANPTVHPIMIRALEHVHLKNKCLLLGDASLVQSKYLLEVANFDQVINVDSSPTLLDNGYITSNKKLKTVCRQFINYDFEDRFFNFIYGKSIAFNPKNTIFELMKKIQESLTLNGIFAAVWAAQWDDFRKIHYTNDELLEMYRLSNFEIIDFKENHPTKVNGLLRVEGFQHDISIIAKKK
jgi:hypothetical protein